MAEEFTYDVFLSHSSKDKDVVRDLAERLRGDGLRVWFDEWEILPGDSIPAKIESGLEHSRILVLCMSAHAFGSDWTQLEASTFSFRDPLNKKRRFIPLRFDDTPIKGSLAQFSYLDWRPQNREQAYANLYETCRLQKKTTIVGAESAQAQVAEKSIQLNYESKGRVLLEQLSKLTPRQEDVLRLLCAGKEYNDIAQELGVKTQAIKGRIQRVSKKLGLELLPATRQIDILLGLYCPKETDQSQFQVELTQLQMEALLLLCEGKEYKTIAQELDISAAAVRGRIKLISKKLGIEILPTEQQIGILIALVCPGLILKSKQQTTPRKAQPKPPAFSDHRKLIAFLCYAKKDVSKVKELYKKLESQNIKPWMDEEDLLPGQTRKNQIPAAIRSSDVVIICLSRVAIQKPGYVHKEIKEAIDVASEQPEGVIFLIPARLDECEIPENLRDWQAADLFEKRGYEILVSALNEREKTIA